nr:lactate utilization protein B [Agilicoccus flavus]
MPPFPTAARGGLTNSQQRRNLRHATHTIRDKRAKVVAEVDQWEELRVAGAAIKDRALRHLDVYLPQLEASLTAAGAHVHWARDAEEANRIIVDLVRAAHAADVEAATSAQVAGGEAEPEGETDDLAPRASDDLEVVKVKSMATQEIEMNEALERAGIAAWETDLAELIVQLGHDLPSHILVPAIHRNRSEVRDIFLREMGHYGKPAPEGLTDEPARLAEAARTHLREKFLRASVAISGANFAVAETGTLVVVESEGNGRMCLTLPRTLISVVGIEKVLPTVEDLEVMLRLLPRSSTGERMNPYTSMWTGPTEGDGPSDVHVVLLDNGRTDVLADTVGRSALRCIRCSACLNICPVYERVGGHAYGSAYPGPIGAILTPQLRGLDNPVDRALPYASSLCGACFDVCPVRIPIPELLVHMRHKVVEKKKHDRRLPTTEAATMAAASWLMGDHRRWEAALAASSGSGSVLRRALKKDRIGPLPWPAAPWTTTRDLASPPTQSFRSWWTHEHEDPAAPGHDIPGATPEQGGSR